MVEGAGFEPAKAEPADLQSDPFDRSGTPPNKHATCKRQIIHYKNTIVNTNYLILQKYRHNYFLLSQFLH